MVMQRALVTNPLFDRLDYTSTNDPPFTEGKILSVAYNYECVDHKWIKFIPLFNS